MAVSIFLRTFVSEMMTKDEIISNLMEQLKAANKQIAAQSAHIADITAQLKDALARLESIEQSVKQKDAAIQKEKNRNKGPHHAAWEEQRAAEASQA